MYSQRDEEAHILAEFADQPPGRFLDIGAYDGVNYSNTMCLVERGWSGVMCEPAIEAFRGLMDNHAANPKLTLVHAAIGDKPSRLAQFWHNPTSISTTEIKNRDRFGAADFEPPFYIPLVHLDWILTAFPTDYDFVSIDTEGTSVDLFRCLLGFEEVKPRMICVEFDDRKAEAMHLAQINGYHFVAETAENLLFNHRPN